MPMARRTSKLLRQNGANALGIYGTPDRIRTGTEQCLRLLPATNWATGANLVVPTGVEPVTFIVSGWYSTSELRNYIGTS